MLWVWLFAWQCETVTEKSAVVLTGGNTHYRPRSATQIYLQTVPVTDVDDRHHAAEISTGIKVTNQYQAATH